MTRCTAFSRQEMTPRLPVQQARQVLRYLPASAIVAWELGNEPDHGGGIAKTNFAGYLARWVKVRNALTPIVGDKLAGGSTRCLQLQALLPNGSSVGSRQGVPGSLVRCALSLCLEDPPRGLMTS